MVETLNAPGAGLHVGRFRNARSTRPRWLNAVNRVARPLARLTPFRADAMWEKARSQVRDAPEPRPAAVEALDELARSVEADSALHWMGLVSGRDDTLRMARTHLRVEKSLRDQPAIADTVLPEPVFVIGWPRTGSTFLHTLLAQDPDSRSIPYWESFDPVPPSSGADTRPEKVERMLAQLERFAPQYHAIHPMSANAPEECVALFMNDFRTLQYDIQYRAPGYVDWLLAQDARIAYRDYQRQLALIQHHRPHGTRQVLKDPTHLIHLDAIVELFPRARFVFTHRDPAEALSSICSLYAYTRAIFSDDVDPRALGREILAGYWPRALERSLETAEKIPAERRCNVRYPDLVRDPLGTAQAIYAALGIPFAAAAREAMQRFLGADAGSGAHDHSLEDYGSSAAALRERFAAYCERFDL